MPEHSFNVVPLSPLRKAIAARTVEAKRTIPHYRVRMDIRMDNVLTLRSQVNKQSPENRISVNDVVVKACAAALLEQPELNVQLVDDEIRRFRHTDISIVVAVPGGLSTPVVRAADTKTLAQISQDVRELTDRAIKNQLRRSEIVGGTLGISNLGMYGVDEFDAVINPPQCAILAIGAARNRPVVQDGGVTAAAMMTATLALDHRVIDGTTGAGFLKCLREKLEDPKKLFAAEEI